MTGLAQPELLRASPAITWQEAGGLRTRLNPFNGFPLAANVDALFIGGLVSFTDDGTMICAPFLDDQVLPALGVHPNARLRMVLLGHRHCLAWHRRHVFQREPPPDPELFDEDWEEP